MNDQELRRSQGQRLRQARERAGYRSGREAALANKWPESTYRSHETGDRTIGQDDAEKYARRFRQAGVRITGQEILYGLRPESTKEVAPGAVRLVPMLGAVAAGVMLEVDVFDDENVSATISAPLDQQFPYARQTAYSVRGDSMNKLKPRPILEGDVIICADWEDLDLQPRDGMVVVVQRSMGQGSFRERSVKQMQLYPVRVEFHPRSTNVSYEPIVIPRHLDPDSVDEVRILSLVRWTYSAAPLPMP